MIRRLTRTLRVADGAMRAYVARPDASDAPAVIVLHDAAGPDDGVRAACDALARLGYLAVCPDLFWRGTAGGKADFDPRAAVDDVVTIVEAIRRETLGGEGVVVLGRGPPGVSAGLAALAGDLQAALIDVELATILAEPAKCGTEGVALRVREALESCLGRAIVRQT